MNDQELNKRPQEISQQNRLKALRRVIAISLAVVFGAAGVPPVADSQSRTIPLESDETSVLALPLVLQVARGAVEGQFTSSLALPFVAQAESPLSKP